MTQDLEPLPAQPSAEDHRDSSLPDIAIKFIDEKNMRYKTQGDWFFDTERALQIRACGDSDHEKFLTALHELVEAYLCRANGVTQESVDAFDVKFEQDRLLGKHDLIAEPGDDALAPYHAEHRQAMLIEHVVAQFLGLFDYGTVR